MTKNLSLSKRADMQYPMSAETFDQNYEKIDAAFDTVPKDDDGKVDFRLVAPYALYDSNGSNPAKKIWTGDAQSLPAAELRDSTTIYFVTE